MSNIRIALVGNPNTGKSSLFNALTGLKQKVGNFPGITVEKSTGYFKISDSLTAELTDLPGTYSLFPKSKDEAIPFQVLLNEGHKNHPDMVLFIADASNLKRNLVLLTQIIDLRLPVILALNMMDQAEAKGIHIDIPCLTASLGIPVIPVNARRQKGIPELIARVREGAQVSEKSFYGGCPVEVYASGSEELPQDGYKKILRLHHALANPGGKQDSDIPNLDAGVLQREDLLHRYRKVAAILKSCVSEEEQTSFKKRQERIDKILTHKVWGYVIFLSILFLVFQAVFNWAQYPMELIDGGFSYLSQLVSKTLPSGILNDLVTNGIMAGLSGVIVFIPQIAFLFFFITIMEDTGYLARVAFLMDRTMRRFGLNGKSVIPLISGTACAVPAIMASRNIENAKSRLITILVTPLMSCSARLPVYILLIGLVIPNKPVLGIFNMQGLALMGMYLLGFLAAIGAAWVYHIIMKNKVKQYFILEMPVYRMPNWKTVGIAVYKKVSSFVTEAGKIIVAISVVLWFLASYGPANGKLTDPVSMQSVQMPANSQEDADALRLENSYAGYLGHSIQPVVAPLGFDWKISIALITSFAAREVFVGTVSTLYGLQGDGADFTRLKANMQKARDAETGRQIYSLATVLALLVFYAFAMQCMSTMAVTYKETASLKWTLVQFGYMTGLAYLCSLLVYQLLR